MFFKVLQINQLIELCSRKCRWHLITLCFYSANRVPLQRQGSWWGWQFASHGSSGMWGCGFEHHQVNKKQHRMHWPRAETVCGDGGQGSSLQSQLPSILIGPRADGFICLFRTDQQRIRAYLLWRFNPLLPPNIKVRLLLCPFSLIS